MVNVGITAYNIDHLGIKAFLKTTGKQTAKVMVKGPDGNEVKETPEQQQEQHQQEKTNGNEVQKKDEKE